VVSGPAPPKSQPALCVSVPQPLSAPVSFSRRSRTRRVQVPCRCLPSKRASWSFWGRKLPVYGGVPADMPAPASSSKTVPLRLSPLLSGPPGCSASFTVVPSGPVRSMRRSPTDVWAIPSIRTFRSFIRPGFPTWMEDVTPAAVSSGIDTAGEWMRGTTVGGWGAPVGSIIGTDCCP